MNGIRVWLVLSAFVWLVWGCGHKKIKHDFENPRHSASAAPDTRESVPLSVDAAQEHRMVMVQHLETVEHIVAALAEENFERARFLTEAHLGFFMHRQVMARQTPQDFPPSTMIVPWLIMKPPKNWPG